MSVIKATTLSNLAGSKTVPTDTVVDGSAKAWVNFNGTGTVAIRRAFNVSSITDNGTGDYTVNFTTALPDANFVVVGSTSNAANTGKFLQFTQSSPSVLPSPSAVRVFNDIASNGTGQDCSQFGVAIFS